MNDKKKIWLIPSTGSNKVGLNTIINRLDCDVLFADQYSSYHEDKYNIERVDGMVIIPSTNMFNIDINIYDKYTRDHINLAVASKIPIFLIYTTKSGQTNIYTTSFRNSIISGISGTTEQFSKLKSRNIKDPEEMEKEYLPFEENEYEEGLKPPSDENWEKEINPKRILILRKRYRR